MKFEDKVKMNSHSSMPVYYICNDISHQSTLKEFLRFLHTNKSKKEFNVAYCKTIAPVDYFWLITINDMNIRIADIYPEIDAILLPLLKREN